MEELQSTLAGGPSEIVLTYRQAPEEPEPVVLRYERPLPASMRTRRRRAERRDERHEYAEERRPARRPSSPINPPERKRRNWGVRLYVGVSLLVILVCLGVGVWYVSQYGWATPDSRPPSYDDPPPESGGYYHWDSGELKDETITIPSYPTGGEARLSLDASAGLPVLTPKEIYDQVTPSVVAVLGRQRARGSASTDLIFNVGTGIIFSSDGYILTNCHVIAGCSSCDIWITDAYGVVSSYEACVVGYDADVDLAVLKIEAEGLTAAAFGISNDLQVGDPTYAIGNPLGVDLLGTMTSGIVSASNRDVEVDGVTMTLIQTDAALNSGNSGGPLINQYGQVVGINTIKMMSDYDTIEGLGFAIPSSFALRWVNELIAYGELQPQPVLGVQINKIPQILPDGTMALLIETVTPGLSGDRAGLQAGDYLVSFNGQPVNSVQQVLNIRRDLRVGDEVPMRLYRDGEYLEKTMIMMAE